MNDTRQRVGEKKAALALFIHHQRSVCITTTVRNDILFTCSPYLSSPKRSYLQLRILSRAIFFLARAAYSPFSLFDFSDSSFAPFSVSARAKLESPNIRNASAEAPFDVDLTVKSDVFSFAFSIFFSFLYTMGHRMVFFSFLLRRLCESATPPLLLKMNSF